jgi:hypothetical protein
MHQAVDFLVGSFSSSGFDHVPGFLPPGQEIIESFVGLFGRVKQFCMSWGETTKAAVRPWRVMATGSRWAVSRSLPN